MDEKIDNRVAELRNEAERIREAEKAARAAGKVDEADELSRRIARLEGEVRQLVERLRGLAAQSYAFDVTRNSEKLITRIVATPIQP